MARDFRQLCPGQLAAPGKDTAGVGETANAAEVLRGGGVMQMLAGNYLRTAQRNRSDADKNFQRSETALKMRTHGGVPRRR